MVDTPTPAECLEPGNHHPPRFEAKRTSIVHPASHISDLDVEEWQSSIDIVLRRFAEYHDDLEGAFGRRASIERAKGILVERHAVSEASAFDMLRQQSRTENRKLIDLAVAVVDGHRPLPRQPAAPQS